MYTRLLHTSTAKQSRKIGKCYSLSYYRRVFYFLSLLVSLFVASTAQGQSEYASTPPTQAAGSPSGSYALDNFESINLYNGHLNVSMPLLQISGRGSAKFSVKVPLQTHKWSVFNQAITNPSTGETTYISLPEGGGDASTIWQPYGPGMLYGQTAIDSPYSYNPVSLTRLVFRTPDGSEFEFRDQLTEGKPYSCPGPYYNCTTPFSRGNVFKTYDGSKVIFLSDTDIVDTVSPGIQGGFYGNSFLSSQGVYLTAGQHVMRVVIDNNGAQLPNGAAFFGNINYFTFAGPQSASLTDHLKTWFYYYQLPTLVRSPV